eukprot:5842997-Ditylum_brightwellii.AAC.1
MKNKVDCITEELQKLLLEQQRIARHALRLQSRLIKINREEEDAVPEQLNEPEPLAQWQREVVVRGQDGTNIRQGDTVVFLTSGAYLSHGGVVTDADHLWVTARDNQGSLICQAPHNVRVTLP